MSGENWDGEVPLIDGETRKLSFNKQAAKRMRSAAERVRKGHEIHIQQNRDPFWQLDSNQVCTPGASQENENKDMIGLLNSLCQSRTGEAFLNAAREAGYEFRFDDQVISTQCYPEDKLITLNPNLSCSDQALALIESLHVAWYESQGLLITPLSFEPDEAILFNRAQKANILLSKVKIALERRLSGDNELWNQLCLTPVGNMMAIVAARVADDFRSLNNGQALCMAYNYYFESDFVKLHDKRLIHTMLLDEGGYVFSSVEPSSHLTDELLIRLGKLPFGTNHILVLLKECSPSDPEYWMVEDRSNANFLWFIKFERSFQVQESAVMCPDNQADIVEFDSYKKDLTEDADETVDNEGAEAEVVLLLGRGHDHSGDSTALF